MKLQPSAQDNQVKGFSKIESCEIYTLSCLLDPRVKKWCSRSQEKLDDAVKLLVEKVQEECPIEISNEAEDVPNVLWELLQARTLQTCKAVPDSSSNIHMC